MKIMYNEMLEWNDAFVRPFRRYDIVFSNPMKGGSREWYEASQKCDFDTEIVQTTAGHAVRGGVHASPGYRHRPFFPAPLYSCRDGMQRLKDFIKSIPGMLPIINKARRVSLPFQRAVITVARRTGLDSFDRHWRQHSKFPEKIGLSLSLACPARCIYCARERGIGVKERFMPYALVEKIAAEAAENGYAGLFSLGENGEAMANPDFSRILMLLRRRFPENTMVLFTNMMLLTEEITHAICDARLDVIHFNIDGARPETYRYIKGVDRLDSVKQNVELFFKIRDATKATCKAIIGYVPARAYAYLFEGTADAFVDDTEEIRLFARQLLRPGDELNNEINVLLQAHQDELKRKKREPCDSFETVLREMLIAPDGRVYVCCKDFALTSNLGNIGSESMAGVWSGNRRRILLKNLFLGRYALTPEGCRYCLPGLGVNNDLYDSIRKHIRKIAVDKNAIE